MKQLLRKQLLLLAMVCATTAYAQTVESFGDLYYYDRFQKNTSTGEIIYEGGSEDAWVTTVDQDEWTIGAGGHVKKVDGGFQFGDSNGHFWGTVESPDFNQNTSMRLELSYNQANLGEHKSDIFIYSHWKYTDKNGNEQTKTITVYADLKHSTQRVFDGVVKIADKEDGGDWVYNDAQEIPKANWDGVVNITQETGKLTIEIMLPKDYASNGHVTLDLSGHGNITIGASSNGDSTVDIYSEELVLRDDWDNTQRLIKNAGKQLKKVIVIRSYYKGWYTLSLPFNLTMKQFQRRYMASFNKTNADNYTWKENTCAEIWHYDALDEGSKVMHFRKHNTDEYVLQAGVPYLIYVPEDISKTLYDFTRTSDEQVSSTDYKQGEQMMVFTNITIPDSLKTTDNDNKEVLNTKMSKVTRGNTAYAFASNLGATDIKKIADANKVYYLHTDTLGENPELYTPNAASITNDTIITDGTIKEVKVMKIKGFRAYFISPLEPTQAKKSLRFSDDNVVTAIDKINVRPEENMPIFNLQGQHMNNDLKNLPRGIYIMNGKKYVVK